MAAIVIIFVSSVCVFSRWRGAPGKTDVEKCLFFIRQMETDGTQREGKYVGPERDRGRGRGGGGTEGQKNNEKLKLLWFSPLFSLSLCHSPLFFSLTSAAERQLTKSVEQLMQ